jgi:branched-chain amino acid transport system ATP-binding protein
LLRLENVSTYYGKFEAIKGISLDVQQREMVTLIGANGAGKSTILRTICGLEKPKKGKILLENQEITFLETVDCVRRGIVYCPEGRKLFRDMTVMENLEMGAYTSPQGIEENLDRVFELFPVLSQRRGQRAGSLSGGEQQMLAIGRTLMSGPRVILFDEPSTGLAPILVLELMKVIKLLNEQGKTILLVEQNVPFALEISRRGYIIENGRIVLEGEVSALKDNKEVKEAYLGG